MTNLHGVFEHAVEHHGLTVNPRREGQTTARVYDAARFDFYSPEEIEKLITTAAAGAQRDPSRPAVSDTERALRTAEDRQDSAIYLTAALSGLRRGELLALRWEDVDFEQSSIRVFEGYSANRAGKPKSRKSLTLPMVDKVADTLSALKDRGEHTAKGDLVFVNREGAHVDGSAPRRRYHATLDAAKLRRLRFHDLRHTFGSLSINVASIVQVQAWMGRADIQTTMRYLAAPMTLGYCPRPSDPRNRSPPGAPQPQRTTSHQTDSGCRSGRSKVSTAGHHIKHSSGTGLASLDKPGPSHSQSFCLTEPLELVEFHRANFVSPGVHADFPRHIVTLVFSATGPLSHSRFVGVIVVTPIHVRIVVGPCFLRISQGVFLGSPFAAASGFTQVRFYSCRSACGRKQRETQQC